jgi:hypothetical protein
MLTSGRCFFLRPVWRVDFNGCAEKSSKIPRERAKSSVAWKFQRMDKVSLSLHRDLPGGFVVGEQVAVAGPVDEGGELFFVVLLGQV